MTTPKKKGRKPSPDPKLELRMWIEKSIIDANGGMEKSKEITYKKLAEGRN